MGDTCLSVAVVDDNPVDCATIRRLLARQHAQVQTHEFHSAADAIAGIPGLSADVVLLDCNLGEGTGLEVLAALQHASVDVPVVCLTGQPDAETALALSRAGAADYLSKASVSASTLRRVLSRVIDEHQQRHAERQRQEAIIGQNQRLRASNKEIATFHHTLSHELRIPLASLRELISVLADEIPGELNSIQAEYMQVCKSSCDHLAAMIDDLFDRSRIATGNLSISPEVVGVPTLLHDVVGVQSHTASRQQVELVTAHVDASTVWADPRRLKQVLFNLIDNALRFATPGGTVSVTVRDVADEVEFVVRDTGKGIPPHELSTIFARAHGEFVNSSPSLAGLGIGLPLCKELVEKQGGTIRVQSEFGVGSEFSFTLPQRASTDSRESSWHTPNLEEKV